MGFTLSYRTLFEVKVLHHFFLNRGEAVFDNMNTDGKATVLESYDVSDFISIVPTPDCAKLISKYRLICKNTAQGLILGMRANLNAGKYFPVIAPDDNVQFTFKIAFSDPLFQNYTSLPLLQDRNSVYFFQNRVTGSPKKFPALPTYAPVFSAGHTYSSGDILGDAAVSPTKLYTANKLTVAAPPGADWTEDALVAGAPLQYANINDLLPVYSDSVRFDTGTSGLNLSMTMQNRAGDTLTPPLSTTIENGNTVALIDIHALPEDFYSVTLTDVSKPYSAQFSFYLLASTRNTDALLNISVKSDDATYDLLAGDGSLKEPVFELRFKNRSSVWRYLGEQFTNLPESGPHPLTNKGVVAVTVKDKTNTDVNDMPNPNVRMVKTEHPPNDNQHYNVISEIYIH